MINTIVRRYTFFLLLITLLSTIVLMGSVPPVDRDALTHHLAVPKLYVQQGGIHELPDIIPSYYPQLLDLLYGIPLIFHNDIVPKYIHFLFALLTAFIIFRYTRKKVGYGYALFSVILFLSLPVIIKLSITVYVDLGLIFFSTASFLSLLKWYETKKRRVWFVLSAVFCGLALSTKYNGLISLFLLTFFVPAVYLKGSNNTLTTQLRAVGFAFMYLSIAVLVFSPWMIKNYVWTKNPVYPLYNTFFNSKVEVDSKKIISKPTMNHFLIRKLIYKEVWWETALTPVRIFFQGEDDNPKLFDGKLNPLLFILPIFAFINFRTSKPIQDSFEQKALLSFSFLYIIAVFFQNDMRIRWIGPAIPPLIVLSAFGVKSIFNLIKEITSVKTKKSSAFYRVYIGLVSAFIFVMMSLNGIYLYRVFQRVDPLPYLSKKITREEYIEKFRPEFAALNFANKNLKMNTKILGLSLGNRGYYSDHEINFNMYNFLNIIKNSNNNDDIRTELLERKYTDIVLNYEEFNNWINTNFSKQEKILIKDFFDLSVNRIFCKGGYGLFHLK